MVNPLNILAEKTHTRPHDWIPLEGFPTGLGDDYYFLHPQLGKGHVNLEEETAMVAVNGVEIFSGMPVVA